MPDPDNPQQLRQIDVLIRRGPASTLVECRNWSQPQGVKWVEELMGRRKSLGADGIIGVSSSGFTKGAKAKAKNHQVLLRDLRKLTDLEVVEWGKVVSLELSCYQFSDVEIQLDIEVPNEESILPTSYTDDLSNHPGVWQTIFNAFSRVVDEKKLVVAGSENKVVRFSGQLEVESFFLAGRRVRMIDVSGRARLTQLPIGLPGFLAFRASDELSANTVVQNYDLGGTEIIYHQGEVALTLDLSKIELPPLSLFRYCHVSSDEEKTFSSFSVIEPQRIAVTSGSVGMTLRFSHPSA